MKIKPLYILLPFLLLTSCSTRQVLVDDVFCFDSMVRSQLYEGNQDNLKDLRDIFNKLDKLTDNYQSRGVNNVYTINQTNEVVSIDGDLYDILQKSISFKNNVSNLFNPLCGGLAKKWKESLKNGQILDENIKNEELSKINSSSLVLIDGTNVTRIGEAEIDLGAVTKGYALDKAFSYLQEHDIKDYLINCGKSSILLGEKKSKNGLYTIKMDKEISPNTYLKLKNCFVSTSGSYVQGKEIGGVMYSHIINPVDGSAVNKHDAVIVVSQNGLLGDAISTVMMLQTIDEIKETEIKCDVKALVYDNQKLVYGNKDIEVFH